MKKRRKNASKEELIVQAMHIQETTTVTTTVKTDWQMVSKFAAYTAEGVAVKKAMKKEESSDFKVVHEEVKEVEVVHMRGAWSCAGAKAGMYPHRKTAMDKQAKQREMSEDEIDRLVEPMMKGYRY